MSKEKSLIVDLDNKNKLLYHDVVFFDADQRLSREDLDIWPEGKLDRADYKEKLMSLEGRGFQEYFPQITLTKTEFQPDARFLTVQDKDADKEAERLLNEIERETEKKWQLEVIVETYEQNQKKMRIFIREKYSPKALIEYANTLREYFGGNYLLKKTDKDYPHDYVCWVVEALEEAKIDKARSEYEQQGDKWRDRPMFFLEEALFDVDNMSTKQRIKKWADIDS